MSSKVCSDGGTESEMTPLFMTPYFHTPEIELSFALYKS